MKSIRHTPSGRLPSFSGQSYVSLARLNLLEAIHLPRVSDSLVRSPGKEERQTENVRPDSLGGGTLKIDAGKQKTVCYEKKKKNK